MTHTILTVDDSKVIRDMLAFTLTQYGYQVLAAESAAQAMDLLEYNKTDCVLTDMNMPEADGIALTKRIRSQPQYEKLPIVMMSDENNDIRRQAGRNAGATAWLDKPVKSDELIAVIRKYCS
ncbi:MAG: response regulator [Bdellovibrionales bacterium]